MKEQLYTIPITDALKEADFCPFCFINENLEKETLEYTLGPSYMEGDLRAKSDEKGFCEKHYNLLLKDQNKLGIALISHTHIQKLIKDIEALKDNSIVAKKSLFKKNSEEVKNPLISYLKETKNSCIICTRISNTFHRYMENFLYLFINDKNINSLFLNSKGVCHTHLSLLLDTGEKQMKEKDFLDFKNIIINKALSNLKILEADLDFFISKFDYKNKDKPWGNQKDVLNRVNKTLK